MNRRKFIKTALTALTAIPVLGVAGALRAGTPPAAPKNLRIVNPLLTGEIGMIDRFTIYESKVLVDRRRPQILALKARQPGITTFKRAMEQLDRNRVPEEGRFIVINEEALSWFK